VGELAQLLGALLGVIERLADELLVTSLGLV
jgi:hypothetical protein